MEVFVTGFEPWGEEDYNPSGEVAKRLDGQVIGSARVRGLVLPVSYKRAKEILINAIDAHRPRIILGVGLAPNTTCIRVERVAINVMDGGPDVDDYKPVDEPIDPNGPAAYFATIPIRRIVEKLKENGIPAVISNSAGTFLCNFVMYCALHHVALKNYDTRVGFIHVPYTSQQSARKQKTFMGMLPPSMPLELIEKGIRIAVEEIIGELEHKHEH
ncbi:MAG: pyroglutamyl-peptidase I [Candidatus Baldrarchaeia archaeon]